MLRSFVLRLSVPSAKLDQPSVPHSVMKKLPLLQYTTGFNPHGSLIVEGSFGYLNIIGKAIVHGNMRLESNDSVITLVVGLLENALESCA